VSVLAGVAQYVPSAEDLARGLPDMADGLHAQLCELSARPTPDGAEILACNLAGAHRAILRLREAILREGAGDGQR
jgi:hypothetical protein